MNAFTSVLYRDLTCAAAAILISLVLAMSFVQSSAAPAGMQTVTITAARA